MSLPDRIVYLDASALVKLVLPEEETTALLDALAAWPQRVTSVLARVEVMRAARRASPSAQVLHRAGEVLRAVHLLALDVRLLEEAARLEPPELRAPDAIHLASALSLGNALGAFVAYDHRLADAARALGIEVLAPR